MIFKLLILLGIFFYVYFIPISSFIIVSIFVLQLILGTFSDFYINFKEDIVVFMIYLLFILQLNLKFQIKKGVRVIIYFFFYFIVIITLTSFKTIYSYNGSISEMLVGFEGVVSFPFVILIYIEILNLKYKNIKQTFQNLNKNFYIFILLTLFLFILKFYMFFNNTVSSTAQLIKIPSFYFLFLIIPISVLIIYFYTKDLEPIIKTERSKHRE